MHCSRVCIVGAIGSDVGGDFAICIPGISVKGGVETAVRVVSHKCEVARITREGVTSNEDFAVGEHYYRVRIVPGVGSRVNICNNFAVCIAAVAVECGVEAAV